MNGLTLSLKPKSKYDEKNGIFLVWGFWQLVCLSAAGQVDVTFHRASLPVLSGEENNHVGYLQAIRQAGSKDRMTGLSYSFEGTDLSGSDS